MARLCLPVYSGLFFVALIFTQSVAFGAQDSSHSSGGNLTEGTEKSLPKQAEQIATLERFKAFGIQFADSQGNAEVANQFRNIDVENMSPGQLDMGYSIAGRNKVKFNAVDKSGEKSQVTVKAEHNNAKAKEETFETSDSVVEFVDKNSSSTAGIEKDSNSNEVKVVSDRVASSDSESAKKDRALFVAAFLQGMDQKNKEEAAAKKADESEVLPTETDFEKAQGGIENAVNTSRIPTEYSGSEHRRSSSRRKSMAERLRGRAKSSLGLANGNVNLSNFSGASPKIQSSLSNLAFNSLKGKRYSAADSNTLMGLATDPSFQEMISSKLSREAVQDFNLSTAGAEIMGNSDLPEIGADAAKSYILNNLSSAQMIQDSPALKSLGKAIGGTGSLALQDPFVLRWLEFANQLGTRESDKIPAFLSSKSKSYQKAYPEMIVWLKGLEQQNAMGSLSDWKLSWEKEKYDSFWRDYHQSFYAVHKDTKAKEQSLIKGQEFGGATSILKEMKMFTGDLQKIMVWLTKHKKLNMNVPVNWVKNAGIQSKIGKMWQTNYEEEYQWAHLYLSKMYFVSATYSQVAKNKAVMQLIADAQEWAAFVQSQNSSSTNSLVSGKR